METLSRLLPRYECKPPLTGGFPSKRASDVDVWSCLCCPSKQIVLSMIWEAIMLMISSPSPASGASTVVLTHSCVFFQSYIKLLFKAFIAISEWLFACHENRKKEVFMLQANYQNIFYCMWTYMLMNRSIVVEYVIINPCRDINGVISRLLCPKICAIWMLFIKIITI